MNTKKAHKKLDFEWITMYTFYSKPAEPLPRMLNFGGYFYPFRNADDFFLDGTGS